MQSLVMACEFVLKSLFHLFQSLKSSSPGCLAIGLTAPEEIVRGERGFLVEMMLPIKFIFCLKEFFNLFFSRKIEFQQRIEIVLWVSPFRTWSDCGKSEFFCIMSWAKCYCFESKVLEKIELFSGIMFEFLFFEKNWLPVKRVQVSTFA